MISFVDPAPATQGAEMRQAFMSIEMGFTTYSEGMTLCLTRRSTWESWRM
jgi:hypothetical protein